MMRCGAVAAVLAMGMAFPVFGEPAGEVEVVLQQGVDGYDGCVDTHMTMTSYGDGRDLPHSASPELMVNSRMYSGF
jgi:hypothetical protein